LANLSKKLLDLTQAFVPAQTTTVQVGNSFLRGWQHFTDKSTLHPPAPKVRRFTCLCRLQRVRFATAWLLWEAATPWISQLNTPSQPTSPQWCRADDKLGGSVWRIKAALLQRWKS